MRSRALRAPALSVVWMRTRSELGQRWRMLTVLAVVVGLGGGASIAAFAGAQRTDTALSLIHI